MACLMVYLTAQKNYHCFLKKKCNGAIFTCLAPGNLVKMNCRLEMIAVVWKEYIYNSGN